jgi:hypothetical protein
MQELKKELLDLRDWQYEDEFMMYMLGDVLPGRLDIVVDNEIRSAFAKSQDRKSIKLPW